MPEISGQDFRALQDQVRALANQLNQARNRIEELEDFATDHIGLDWGESLVDANSPHPNISVNTAEYGGGVMRIDKSGQQIKMPGGGTSQGALFFVKDFWVTEDGGGRYRGDPQVEISANYNGTSTNQLRLESYLTRDVLLSGLNTALYLTNVNGSHAVASLVADYNGDGNYAELIVKKDSSGNFIYQIHKGSGVYADIGGGLKTSGGGYYLIPAGPSIGTSATSSAGAYGSWVEMRAASGNALYIVGVSIQPNADGGLDYIQIDIGTGAAASETSVGEERTIVRKRAGTAGESWGNYHMEFMYPIPVAASTRIACRVADDVGSLSHAITLHVIDQADVVSI